MSNQKYSKFIQQRIFREICMDLTYYLQNRHLIKANELYAFNLPKDVNQEFIIQFFSQWASVKSVKVFKYLNGQTLSSALIRFYDFESMMLALKESQGISIRGQIIRVRLSQNAALVCGYCNEIGHKRERCKHLASSSGGNFHKRPHNKSNERSLGSLPKNSSLQKSFTFSKKPNHTKKNLNHSHANLLISSLGNLVYDRKNQSRIEGDPPLNFKQNDFQDKTTEADQTFYDQEVSSKNEDRASRNRKQKQIELVTIINSNSDNQSVLTMQEEEKLEYFWRNHYSSICQDGQTRFVRIVKM